MAGALRHLYKKTISLLSQPQSHLLSGADLEGRRLWRFFREFFGEPQVSFTLSLGLCFSIRKRMWLSGVISLDYSGFLWDPQTHSYGGTSGKEPACQFRRCKRHEFDPWVRKSPWRTKWQCTPSKYSCLENPMDRGAWPATVHRVTKGWIWVSDWTHTLRARVRSTK